MIIELVTSEPLLRQVRDIFREYQSSLGIDLCYENFEEELSNLPDKYAPPEGRLYLAFIGEQVAGCIALKPYQEHQCEMKRLYVRPQYRGRNLGRILANKVIDDARQIGYRQMLLETLPSLKIAQELYRSLGFIEIPAYSYNPEGAKHLGLVL
jgi:putative acetyltransferase